MAVAVAIAEAVGVSLFVDAAVPFVVDGVLVVDDEGDEDEADDAGDGGADDCGDAEAGEKDIFMVILLMKWL